MTKYVDDIMKNIKFVITKIVKMLAMEPEPSSLVILYQLVHYWASVCVHRRNLQNWKFDWKQFTKDMEDFRDGPSVALAVKVATSVCTLTGREHAILQFASFSSQQDDGSVLPVEWYEGFFEKTIYASMFKNISFLPDIFITLMLSLNKRDQLKAKALKKFTKGSRSDGQQPWQPAWNPEILSIMEFVDLAVAVRTSRSTDADRDAVRQNIVRFLKLGTAVIHNCVGVVLNEDYINIFKFYTLSCFAKSQEELRPVLVAMVGSLLRICKTKFLSIPWTDSVPLEDPEQASRTAALAAFGQQIGTAGAAGSSDVSDPSLASTISQNSNPSLSRAMSTMPQQSRPQISGPSSQAASWNFWKFQKGNPKPAEWSGPQAGNSPGASQAGSSNALTGGELTCTDDDLREIKKFESKHKDLRNRLRADELKDATLQRDIIQIGDIIKAIPDFVECGEQGSILYDRMVEICKPLAGGVSHSVNDAPTRVLRTCIGVRKLLEMSCLRMVRIGDPVAELHTCMEDLDNKLTKLLEANQKSGGLGRFQKELKQLKLDGGLRSQKNDFDISQTIEDAKDLMGLDRNDPFLHVRSQKFEIGKGNNNEDDYIGENEEEGNKDDDIGKLDPPTKPDLGGGDDFQSDAQLLDFNIDDPNIIQSANTTPQNNQPQRAPKQLSAEDLKKLELKRHQRNVLQQHRQRAREQQQPQQNLHQDQDLQQSPDLEVDHSGGVENASAIVKQDLKLPAASQQALAEQLKNKSIEKMYEKRELQRLDEQELEAVAPQYGKLKKKDKQLRSWTYTRLVQTTHLMKLSRRLYMRMRKMFEQFYQITTSPQKFEWCILIDNSGSMSRFRIEIAEILAFVIESLRKCEHHFAVARFGGARDGCQVILKPFTETFTYDTGDRLLQSLTFNEGSAPLNGLISVTKKLWPSPTQEPGTHRVCLMITDALSHQISTRENSKAMDLFQSKIKKELGPRGVKLAVMQLIGQKTDLTKNLSELLKSVTDGLHKAMELKQLPQLPVYFGDMIIEVVNKVKKDIKSGKKFSEDPPLADVAVDGEAFLYPIDEQVGDCNNSGMKDVDPAELVQVSSDSTPLLNQFCDSSEPKGDYKKFHRELPKLVSSKFDVINKNMPKLRQKRECRDAYNSWQRAEEAVRLSRDDLAVKFEEMFPANHYTQYRPDHKGSKLHVPALIKAEASGWSGQPKIFANKMAGGRRNYSIVIAVDVSASMQGHLRSCTMEALVLMVSSFQKCGIFNFSVIVFGQTVQIIKTEEQEWDPAVIWSLLTSIRTDEHYGTLDAVAVDVATEILGRSNQKSREMFVLTDGYGSCGWQLTQALMRAADSGVTTTAITVGVETSFVPNVYSRWIKAAFPALLPEAFSQLQKGVPAPKDAAWKESVVVLQGSDENVRELLGKRTDDFIGLADLLQGERDQHLRSDHNPGAMTMDVAFLLDATGSMGSFIASMKNHVRKITSNPGIAQVIKDSEFGIADITIRFAVVAYRDYNDSNDVLNFTEDTNTVNNFVDGLHAMGGNDGPEDVVGGMMAA
eukprot:gene939-955_t